MYCRRGIIGLEHGKYAAFFELGCPEWKFILKQSFKTPQESLEYMKNSEGIYLGSKLGELLLNHIIMPMKNNNFKHYREPPTIKTENMITVYTHKREEGHYLIISLSLLPGDILELDTPFPSREEAANIFGAKYENFLDECLNDFKDKYSQYLRDVNFIDNSLLIKEITTCADGSIDKCEDYIMMDKK